MEFNLNLLPKAPGVYIFRNEKRKVLYVGKAINLKNRVSSYFKNMNTLTPKTRALVGKIYKIDHVKTQNELEALLLEAELIKRYRPPYNIDLKDDKSFKYIKIEKPKITIKDDINNKSEKSVWKITTSRKKTEKPDQLYFGPYPESSSINIILKTLRKIFPYRDCSTQKYNRYRKSGRACLYGHIGLCPAPCVKQEGIEENNKNIKIIKDYLEGDRKRLFQRLEKEMNQLSKEQSFEKAAVIRDQLRSYEYLTQNRREIHEYIETPNLVDDKASEALKELLSLLNPKLKTKLSTNKDIFRIEVYDISNFQGSNAVGAMVVLNNGLPSNKDYRRFKINSKDTPDDFAMMAEVIKRRFNPKAKRKKPWPKPDLIVIDGGKGQLSSVDIELEKLKIKIPRIGLAKKFETIIYKNQRTSRKISTENYNELKIPNDSPALHILQRGRDEAHRFGINYYRSLHKKKLLKSN